MTPKDWNKIAKLLEPVADQETLQEVKTLLEGMGNVAAQETADAILTKLNSGVTAGFRKPISMTSVYRGSSGGDVSGTGKGILFLNLSGSVDSITIDGVSLGGIDVTTSYSDEMSVFFEFTSSFYVDFKSYGAAVAVFY